MVRPTGTVTFLFTDIEGSTRLWDEHLDAMPNALGRHDAILRAAIDAHGALGFFRSAFDLARKVGDLNIEGRSLFGLMLATTLLHAPNSAAIPHESDVTDVHRGALLRFHDTRSPVILGQVIDTVAWWFAVNGNDEAAAVVYGYLDARHPPFDFIPVRRMRRDGLRIVRGVAGADEWMARGAAMDAEEVFDFTLAQLPEQPPDRVGVLR